MSTANKHWHLNFISFVLVITIFTTLFPLRLAARVYAKFSSDSYDYIDGDLSYLKEHNNTEPNAGSEAVNRSYLFEEYEQTALEKLGTSADSGKTEPYKRSDVKYEIGDISNAFTRNYALENGNYTRLIFGSPVNYITNEGQWRKIDLSLQKEADQFCAYGTPLLSNPKVVEIIIHIFE